MLNDGTIRLRAPEPADLDTLYIIENDPSLWADGVTFAPLSRKQMFDYIDSYDGNIYSAGQLRLVIESVADGSVAGVIDLYDYDPVNLRAYVGVTVMASQRGHGVGHRALTLLCEYCRDSLHLHQLAAVVRAENRASVALFAGCGFTVTGHFPDWVRRGDDWVDAIHMQRLIINDN